MKYKFSDTNKAKSVWKLSRIDDRRFEMNMPQVKLNSAF